MKDVGRLTMNKKVRKNKKLRVLIILLILILGIILLANKDKIFKKGFPLYIGHTKEKEIINTYRPHKQFDMVTFNNYNNINEVLKYKGEYVFINKEDLELNSNQYLNEDLIGLEVITQNKSLGTLKKIEKYSSKYETLVVENNGKRILIPYNFDIIEKIDLDNKKILVKYIKGLTD